MELQLLQQKLLEQLESKTTGTIVQKDIWCFPVHTINVSYKPVLRTKMDILMKMLLISLQKAKFKNSEQLSEILLVEELFIQDLLSKMHKTGLITKVEDCYQLTEKGLKQLANGVYEEDQDTTSVELLYSPTHQSFFSGDIEEILDFEDFPEKIYRYSSHEEELNIDNDKILPEIRKLQHNYEDDQQSDQLFITSIDAIENVQINDIPCLEFIIFDKEKSSFHARVWNTLLDSWDTTLEYQLQEKEQSMWQEKY
ncbi:hypothetical protein [Lysinibacillus telephonicus]|uniref:hypothetical protein n=1 Tax=Lysinibacillus telephonicus TaxID=1714840 RepID=UPI0037D355A2